MYLNTVLFSGKTILGITNFGVNYEKRTTKTEYVCIGANTALGETNTHLAYADLPNTISYFELNGNTGLLKAYSMEIVDGYFSNGLKVGNNFSVDKNGNLTAKSGTF